MKNKIKIIIALICIIIFLGILLGIKVLLPGYKNTDITDKTNLVINNSNVTNNLKQNQELTQLRDWLLPMLMNGQVRVE